VFGTVDSWLIFNLTGEHLTDATKRLADAAVRHRRGPLGPRAARAVRACPSARPGRGCSPAPMTFGRDAPRRRLQRPLPSRSAALPATSRRRCSVTRCVDPGTGKNTYGTGSFVLINAGPHRARAAAQACSRRSRAAIGRSRAYATRGVDLRDGRRPCSGLRDGLQIIERVEQTEEARAQPERQRRRVTLCPRLTGLGSPHWDPHARGTIVGLTRGSGARAPRAPRDAGGDRLPDARRRARRWRPRARSPWPSCAPMAGRARTAG